MLPSNHVSSVGMRLWQPGPLGFRLQEVYSSRRDSQAGGPNITTATAHCREVGSAVPTQVTHGCSVAPQNPFSSGQWQVALRVPN